MRENLADGFLNNKLLNNNLLTNCYRIRGRPRRFVFRLRIGACRLGKGGLFFSLPLLYLFRAMRAKKPEDSWFDSLSLSCTARSYSAQIASSGYFARRDFRNWFASLAICKAFFAPKTLWT